MESPPLIIRCATADDLDDLVDLEDRAFPVDRISRRAWRHLLTRAHARVLLATAPALQGLGGAAVVLFRSGSEVARLYSLAVAPEARGRGVGRALLAAVLAAARRHGARRVRLEVRDTNEVALSLYRTAGFRAVASLPGYYADGADGLRMEATLDPGSRGGGKHLFQSA